MKTMDYGRLTMVHYFLYEVCGKSLQICVVQKPHLFGKLTRFEEICFPGNRLMVPGINKGGGMIRSYPVTHQKPKLWVEILITVLGIGGVLIFFALYETAFPDASVDVTISRAQAEEIAENHLEELGYSVEGYKSALSFSSDSSAAY
jgi:hypothetical protein